MPSSTTYQLFNGSLVVRRDGDRVVWRTLYRPENNMPYKEFAAALREAQKVVAAMFDQQLPGRPKKSESEETEIAT